MFVNAGKELLQSVHKGMVRRFSGCPGDRPLRPCSSLGRNQLHTGLYIEEIFPSYDVRYIAVNDGVDTLYETSSELMPFKNLFNLVACA